MVPDQLRLCALGYQINETLGKMNLSDDFLDRWRHIISDIKDKTAIPVECIEKVIIKFDKRRRKTVNFKQLRSQGLELDEIETVLARNLEDLGETVYDLELVVDVESVATIIQPETNRILSNL